MKVKSSALFGLMVVICSISGFSLLRRLTQEVDEWRPSNLYSSTNITRRSTFSVVSSAPASSSDAVATIASGSESLFSHGGATLYAPAMSMPSASMSMGPSSGGGLYTTSSAELRSFGGGGNGGGVSMSGGSAKSSGPSMASAGLSVSMPSTSVFAYNTNRNNSVANDAMSSVSSDIAMASTQAYAGIGNTTGGASRGISGRRESNGVIFNSWWNWLSGHNDERKGVQDENGNWIYTYDKYDLQNLYNAFVAFWSKNFGSDDIPSYDEWLWWYMSTTGSDGYSYKNNTYLFQPIGSILPLVVMVLFYLCYTIVRRKIKVQI